MTNRNSFNQLKNLGILEKEFYPYYTGKMSRLTLRI